MDKLNIIQIIDQLSVGGAEVLAVNIANGLFEQKIESHICVTRTEGVLRNTLNPGVGYVFLNRRNTFDIKAILKLYHYIKKHSIKIIHAHSTSIFIAVCVKILNPKVKIVWHDHFGNSNFLNERKKIPLKIFSFFISAIVAVNSNLVRWAKEELRTKKVVFFKNFPVFTNDKKVTKLNGIPGKRIVHLAGYREQKDHINLLKAFKNAQEKHNDWSLHLIGKAYIDDYSQDIKKFIANENLKESVFQYGVRSDVKNILSQASIGVLSSKSEGLPISLLEYGLAKLPVVITDVGECATIVNNKASGFIVEKENPMQLSKALTNLIISDERRKIFGENLEKEIKENFSKEIFLNKITELYHEILC